MSITPVDRPDPLAQQGSSHSVSHVGSSRNAEQPHRSPASWPVTGLSRALSIRPIGLATVWMTGRVSHATASSKANGSPVTCSTRRFADGTVT
jgi:hypothetical protein